jgi:hypothetical protein
LVFNQEILGQNISPKDVVNIKVKTAKLLNKNEIINLDVILMLKDGWHLNANKPLDDYLTPTVVSLDTSNVHIVNEEYPEPLLTKLKFSETQLALYEDETVIKLSLTIKKGFKKSVLKLGGEVQYQPCNDQTCLFPVSKPFSVELHFKN